MLKEYIPLLIRKITEMHPIPSSLSKNFMEIDGNGIRLIEKSIKENYHTGWRSEKNYSKEKYKDDLYMHLYGRINSDRRIIIPWLDNAACLRNKRILEIGCGTGSSTVALAEQGAKVTGIDIDEGALAVARDRCKVYGLKVELKAINANTLSGFFGANAFDCIIFFACLEHMTIVERLTSLKDAWKLLPTDGLLVIVETPNRLWYYDSHTSMLPFFHWLPNELAFAYSKFSSRDNFHELYKNYNLTSKESFLRRGRGVSFHEFDIAIGPTKDLKVISSLSTFTRIRHKLQKTKLERKYKSILMSIYPNIHEGFFDDILYLVIEKK
jgi:2-polyprenyl-3-methyl-5-hydroxy-6-metoxy-1,4-benzoquinol methylase